MFDQFANKDHTSKVIEVFFLEKISYGDGQMFDEFSE